MRYKKYYVKIFFFWIFFAFDVACAHCRAGVGAKYPSLLQQKSSLGDKIENLQLSEAVLFNSTQHRVKTAFQVRPSEYVFASGRRLDRQMNESMRC